MLITGSTRGIGREAALALAKQGAEVLLVARDKTRGEETLRAVKAASPRQLGEVFYADLSLVADTRRLARDIKARFDRMDVLINNAGALFANKETTREGFDLTFATNHLSAFVLTTELLPLVKARIITTASEAHRGGSIDFADLQKGSGFRAYATSKLENILFTRELARRIAGTGVTANCLHPGVVASNFALERGGIARFFYRLGAPFLKTSEEGSRTITYLAASPAVEGVTGEYFMDEHLAKARSAGRDDAVAAKLWSESERLVAQIS